MAKRSNKRVQQARKRRENAKVRSHQAQINEAARNAAIDYSSGAVPKINRLKLENLSARQLQDLAGNVSREFEEQYSGLLENDKQSYRSAPRIRVSRLERELASRPEISDAEIAAAPARRRKTLRQQQRRRNEAREKIERQKRYIAFDMMNYTVGEVREMERRGESPFEVLGDNVSYETPREHLLRERKNVLGNRSYVRSLIRGGERGYVEKLVENYAGIVGKGRLNIEFPKRHIDGTAHDDDVSAVEQRLEAFDGGALSKFERLTKKQKKWLISNTNFGQIVKDATYYNNRTKKWETVSIEKDAPQTVQDWLSEAAMK